MPPTPPADGRARSTAERIAELNAAIRAFWTGPGGHPALPLSDVQRAQYHVLLAELWAVENGPTDVVEAA